ncbi:MAG TPA: hypothetical protein VGB37_14700 [Candidatus Lokiarchaeia archaeon]
MINKNLPLIWTSTLLAIAMIIGLINFGFNWNFVIISLMIFFVIGFIEITGDLT